MMSNQDCNRSKVLMLFEKRTQESVYKYADRALYLLLRKYESVLPELDERFHTNFRQIDVTDSGMIDMAIWNLLHESELFWQCYKEVIDNPSQESEVVVCPYCKSCDDDWKDSDRKRGKRTHPAGFGVEYHCYSAYCD